MNLVEPIRGKMKMTCNIEKGNVPNMSIEDITKGLNFAIEASLENEVDIKSVEGKTH